MDAKEIQKIVNEGKRIYESIRADYEPIHNGKYLAIEVNSQNVYLADDGAKAVEMAKKEHADKIFYLVKIGFDSLESIARTFLTSSRI